MFNLRGLRFFVSVLRILTYSFLLFAYVGGTYSAVVVVPLLRSSSGVISHPSGRYLRQRVPQWGTVRRKTATLVAVVVVVPLLRSSSGVISHPSGRYLRQRVPQWGIVRRKTATLVAVVQPLLHR